MMKKTICFFAFFLAFQAVSIAENTVVLNALKDEMSRSMEKLKLDNEAGPYFISYLLKDVFSLRITANSGAITINADSRSRTLKIDLRVGDYNLDNSNYVSMNSLISSATSGVEGSFSLDDDYDVLRRQLWLATDRAYKNAVDTLTRKKALLQNTVQGESIPDFSKGEASSNLLAELPFDAKRTAWSQFVERLSKIFLGQPLVQRSKVEYRLQVVNSYYVNSEGVVSLQPYSVARLVVSASAQADDGMPLKNFLVYTAARPEGLPDAERISADTKKMIADLLVLRTAPLAGEYSGPVLFEHEAAGEFLAQGFVANLLTRKRSLSDNPQLNSIIGLMDNPLLTKVNAKVAANFISVKAVPTLREVDRKALLGSYIMDEEGVKCRDVDLVENGILKNMLTSRSPVKGFSGSNGHFRGSTTAPSVIRISSTNKLAAPELKKRLIEAMKEESLPFGYRIKCLTPSFEVFDPEDLNLDSLLAPRQGPPDPMQFKLTKPVLAYKVYPDGKEELVRGAEIGNLSVNSFKNILATSDDSIVYNYPFSGSGIASLLSGGLMGALSDVDSYATVIVPSVLVSGVDLRKPAESYQKPPIVGYPLK